MRLFWSLSAIAVASSVSAFAPANTVSRQTSSVVYSTVAVATSDVKAKQDATLTKLAARDQQSSAISKDVSFVRGLIVVGGMGRVVLI